MESRYIDAYGELYREHWWWRVRERILLGRIRALLGRRAGSARILDIGCGAGLFFDALATLGHVEGIETEEVAVNQSGRWRSHITLGSLESFEPGVPFDIVLLLDVVEHIEAPLSFLRRVPGLVAPGGHVIVTVPAYDWLWTSHDDLNHHFRRYTAGELRRLVNGAGMHTIETRYLFQSLVVPKLAVRAKEAVVGAVAGVPSVPSPVLNLALQRWFRLEHAVAGWLPFGGSAMAVAGLPRPR
jgi:2-polyprenyl-3-methyl-5-hydroxy-6-metoxy-1,4-benzoquinol methylase